MDVKIGIVPQAGDLSRALDEIGQKYIYGSLEKLVQTMPEGSVIFALADQYPTPNLDVKEEILAQTAQKQIKLFLEYPRSVAGMSFGAPEVIVFERLAVTTEQFAQLKPGDILMPCGMFYLPCQAADPLLVLARVAGYDHLAFGLPQKTVPMLFSMPDYPNVLVAAGCLSRFRTGRCMPAASYRALWRGLLKWGTGEEIDIDWKPSAGPAYGPDAKLPQNAGENAVNCSVRWFLDNMIFRIDNVGLLFRDNEESAEEKDAIQNQDKVAVDTLMGGVFEGYEAGVDHNGRQKLRNYVRNDCTGETALVMALDAAATGNPETKKTAVDLCDYLFSEDLYHDNPNDPMYGLLNFCVGWNSFYADDAARSLMSTLTVRSLFGIDRWDKRILRCILANFRTSAKTGFRHNALYDTSFVGQDWRTYFSDTELTIYSPHYQCYIWAVYIWMYAMTDYAPFLEKARTGISNCMAQYPNNWTWTNSLTAEMSRMLLPLSFLVRVDDSAEHRQWLKRIAADVISHMDKCGAVQDYFGALDMGRYPPPQSNQAYGTGEASLIQQNGDPATDLLYTANWAYIGLHEAAIALNDAGMHDACNRMTDFFCRIQVISAEHPYLNGCWMRGFDFQKWEYWGSSADTGWGALCVESGWTNAWICAVMQMRQQGRGLLDLSARDAFKAIAPQIIDEMLEELA